MDALPSASPALTGYAAGGAASAVQNGQTARTAAATGNAGPAAAGAAGKAPGAAKAAGTAGDSVQLSPEAKALVARLQARDADVRAHEAAHVAAGGSLVTGAVSYSYEKGPDGRQYAVGGEVSIDTSAVSGNPRATLAKARQIEAAALAPADPSGQDEAVAGQAQAMAARASAELAAQGSRGAAPRPGAQVDLTA